MICRLCCYILSTMLLLTNYNPIQQGNEMALRHFKPNQYTKDIWNAMVVLFNDNEIGAAAFMGNLYQESNCIPTTNKQSSNYTSRIDNGDISRSTFIQQSQGAYGLVQWYSTARKANLYDGVWDGGEPPSPSNSIGSLNRAFHMIEYEMTDLGYERYQRVYTVLCSTTDINQGTKKAFDDYFIPNDDSLPQRQLFAREIYDLYANGQTGGYEIIVTSTGNGVAFSQPAVVYNNGDDFTIYAQPYDEDEIEDITGETEDGHPIAMSIGQSVTYHYNTDWGNYITVEVTFSGTTPPPEPPKKILEHKLPIWMYPVIRRRFEL